MSIKTMIKSKATKTTPTRKTTPVDAEAKRERLRATLALWITNSRAMLDAIYDRASDMEHELRVNPDSPLSEYLDHEHMLRLVAHLDLASCGIADIRQPLERELPDPIAAMKD